MCRHRSRQIPRVACLLFLHPCCPSSEGQESRTQARLKSFLLELGNMAIGDEERANGQQGKVREPWGERLGWERCPCSGLDARPLPRPPTSNPSPGITCEVSSKKHVTEKETCCSFSPPQRSKERNQELLVEIYYLDLSKVMAHGIEKPCCLIPSLPPSKSPPREHLPRFLVYLAFPSLPLSLMSSNWCPRILTFPETE